MREAMRRLFGGFALGVVVPLAAGAGAPPPCTLRELAAATGVTIGAGFVEGSHDPAFHQTLGREYDGVTVPLYWSQVQPTSDAFDFTAADAAVGEGEASGLRMRGHPLVWGRLALPSWVQAATSPEELRGWLDTRIRTILERYRGRIVQYDVVNEPITLLGDAGSMNGLDVNLFSTMLGPGYVREALEMAHAADPDAKLFVNDFFVLGPGQKQDRFYDLVRELVESGAPIHGVGMQGHLRLPILPDFAPPRAEIDASIARFAALGLDVEITELDVVLGERSVCELAWQRRAYHDVVAACVASPACTGVTTWGITDAFTWIENFFRVDGAPLPFDESYARKPAWFGMRDALADVACPGGVCASGCMLDPCSGSPACAPDAAGCCDTLADCAGARCQEGAGCVHHTCVEGPPIDCDDADPCTLDACDATTGCVHEALSGAAGAQCTCERERPTACTKVPDKAERALTRACAHLAVAESAPPRRQRRLLGKAARRLRAAGRSVARAARRGRLQADCASPLGAFLDDAFDRARAARQDVQP